ncbi:MAG: nucleoside triphosphate pyrophosphohydrolase, partial [Rikenellaceae bacterium]|nr:nucleoside triphosphate pyrophosphohydrolase [Rikenellaceae bacterium]
MEDKRLESVGRLLDVLDQLREKCPWDRKQTFESLRSNTIEEAYELVDAITDGNMDNVKEEIGDLLLHVAFYS